MKSIVKIFRFLKNPYILFSLHVLFFFDTAYATNESPPNTLPRINHERYISYSPVKTGTHLLFNLFDSLLKRESKWENHSHCLPTVPELLNYEHCNMKVISIVRDVRDQLVSAAHYWVKFDNVFPDYLLSSLNITDSDVPLSVQQVQELIYYMISDEWLEIENRMPAKIRNFHNSASIYLVDLPCSLVTKFEYLVGDNGGGDLHLQRNEIHRIAQHLGIQLNIDEISYIANNIFGNSTTFRKGKIGVWRKYFDPSLCEVFKEKFGIDLIIMGYETDMNWTNILDNE